MTVAVMSEVSSQASGECDERGSQLFDRIEGPRPQ